MRRCQEQESAESNGMLVHGDLGFHNIAVKSLTGAVQGVFDHDGAAWTDRHYGVRLWRCRTAASWLAMTSLSQRKAGHSSR